MGLLRVPAADACPAHLFLVERERQRERESESKSRKERERARKSEQERERGGSQLYIHCDKYTVKIYC